MNQPQPILPGVPPAPDPVFAPPAAELATADPPLDDPVAPPAAGAQRQGQVVDGIPRIPDSDQVQQIRQIGQNVIERATNGQDEGRFARFGQMIRQAVEHFGGVQPLDPNGAIPMIIGDAENPDYALFIGQLRVFRQASPDGGVNNLIRNLSAEMPLWFRFARWLVRTENPYITTWNDFSDAFNDFLQEDDDDGGGGGGGDDDDNDDDQGGDGDERERAQQQQQEQQQQQQQQPPPPHLADTVVSQTGQGPPPPPPGAGAVAASTGEVRQPG
jgi:hypothetical protein